MLRLFQRNNQKEPLHIQLAQKVSYKLELEFGEVRGVEIQGVGALITDFREGGHVFIHSERKFEVVTQKDCYLLEKILPEFVSLSRFKTRQVKVKQSGEEKCSPKTLNGLQFLQRMRWHHWMMNT